MQHFIKIVFLSLLLPVLATGKICASENPYIIQYITQIHNAKSSIQFFKIVGEALPSNDQELHTALEKVAANTVDLSPDTFLHKVLVEKDKTALEQITAWNQQLNHPAGNTSKKRKALFACLQKHITNSDEGFDTIAIDDKSQNSGTIAEKIVPKDPKKESSCIIS